MITTFKKWFQKHCDMIMGWTIVMEGIAFTYLSVIYWIEFKQTFEDNSYKIEIFISLFLLIHYCFMVHFAYRSIEKHYNIELIAFLMVGFTAALFCGSAYLYTILYEDQYLAITIINIIMMIIMFLCNLIFLFSFFYVYEKMGLKFFDKIGRKIKNKIKFYWVHLNNSLVKSYISFFNVILLVGFVFDLEQFWFTLIELAIFLILIYTGITIRKEIKKETKTKVILGVLVMILSFLYVLFKTIYFIMKQNLFNTLGNVIKESAFISFLIILYPSIMLIQLVVIIISTFKCISNYANVEANKKLSDILL